MNLKFFVKPTMALLACCCTSYAQSQTDTEETAAVSFFSALVEGSVVFVKWSGQEAFPEGLVSGKSMGPLTVPTETARVEVTSEGFLPASGDVKLTPGMKSSIIFFAGEPEKDAESTELRRRIKIFQSSPVPKDAEKKFEWPVVLLGSVDKADIEVNDQKVTLTRGETIFVALGQRSVTLSQNGRELAAISVEEPSDRSFVVFGEEATKLSAGIIYR